MGEATTVDIKIKELQRSIPLLHWGRVRFVGNIRSLSVSISIGAVLALPDILGTNITEYLKNPQLMMPLVIFVVGIGLAYLTYEVFCPSIIKKYTSLADFYEHQLTIKKLQLETYPLDPFEANMLHVAEHYILCMSKFPIARWVTLLFYLTAFGSLGYLLVRFYQSL